MKKLFTILLLLSSAAILSAQTLAIAVNDFTVASDNASYKYLGKGISRLVASELRKSDRVTLIEREQMNRVLAEQEFSVSDLANASKQIRIGRLLAAQYLVLGEIIDMGPAGMLISVRMVDTTTGAIPGRAEKQGALATYDFLCAYLATALLQSLNVTADKTTVAKIEDRREKKAEAIIKTSQGIDAYDKHDTTAAKEALQEARRLDPANAVAAEYLAKLPGNTSRFKLALEPFYMDENPASLGLLKEDRLYLVGNAAIDALGDLFAFMTRTMYFGYVFPNGDYAKETDWKCKLGYALPLADGLGIQVEFFYFGLYTEVQMPASPSPVFHSYRSLQSGLGGMADCGIKINDWLSLGAGGSVFVETNYVAALFPNWETGAHPAWSLQAGAVLQDPSGLFVYDLQAGYCSGKLQFRDNDAGVVTVTDYVSPLFIEQTASWAVNGKRTYLICKQHNDIGLDRVYYYGSLVPAVEHYFADWCSARLGAELIYSRLYDTDRFGYGGTAGITLVLGRVDVDLSFSLRSKPSRVMAGYSFPEGILTIGVNLNGLIVSQAR